MILETKRLLLRPWEDGDAPQLYEYAKDPDVGPMAGWPPHTSVENSLEIIRGVLGEPDTWAVVLKENGLPVGSIGLMKTTALENCPDLEVGYWIGKPFWGNGYIPEAVQEVLHYGFEDKGADRIWVSHIEENFKSRRVIEKSGFRYQFGKSKTNLLGATHTCLYYAMTREEWSR